ncbi:MAG: hypothetical protein GC184_03600 [Rhizobiales bacterium]|nr:hypothetical protein [Hyphomicrobiales bacterium]
MEHHDSEKDHHADGISRRQILILGAIGLTAAAIPASLLTLNRDSDALTQKLVGLLNNPESAAALGNRWLEETKAHPSLAGMSQKIAKRLRASGLTPESSLAQMHEILAAHVRKDFVKNDMVEIENWQLSRTEAELCILAALSLAPHGEGHEAPAEPEVTESHPA